MNALAVIGESVLFGVCSYAALQHGIIAIRRPMDRMHIMFAMVCVMAAAYFAGVLAQLAFIHVPWMIHGRWYFFFGLAFYASLAWFVSTYTGTRANLLLTGLTALLAAGFWIPLLVPFDLGAVLAFGFYACVRQYRHGARRQAVILGFGLGLFMAALLLKHTMSGDNLALHDIPQLGALILIVVMSYHLMHELRISERQMHFVLDNVPAAIYINDSLGRYLWANRNFEKLFKLRRRNVGGKWGRSFYMEIPGLPTGSNGAPADNGDQSEAREIEIEKEGKTLTYSLLTTPVLQSDETQRGTCGILTDITVLREAEKEAQSLRQQLWRTDRVASIGAMTASIAHELNQPLAAVLSNAQAGIRFLGEQNPDLGEIRAILRDIVRDDKRAADVIGALRNMLRKHDPHRTRINLSKTTREMVGLLNTELMNGHVEVESHYEKGCYVTADKTLIQQVQMNLLINAIEAMQDLPVSRKRIAVSVVKEGNSAVRFMIRDHGIGIDGESFKSLFGMFATTKPKGVGIGLAISRSIIEQLGGVIWAERNLDSGLTFFFRLPAAARTTA